jgi:calcineurin-like phosphoesterase family protein
MTNWFTADTHFGHKLMLQIRAYPSAEAMDDAIVSAWNRSVKPGDHVYHLGDVTFSGHQRTAYLLSILNGQKHLIRGNHDHLNANVMRHFVSEHDYKEVRLPEALGGQKLILSHFPMRSWNKMHYGSIQLHGHSHGTLPPQGRQLDVGIDSAIKIFGGIALFSETDVHNLTYDREIVVVDQHKPKTGLDKPIDYE